MIFSAIKLGGCELNHRIVMAPMTRIRASEDGLAPTNLTAKYYQQRATYGGLIISEAIHISPEATPIWSIYPAVAELGGQVPGLWTDEQIQAWRKVTDAVHVKGGIMACQLLHAGRVVQREMGQHPLVKGRGYPLGPVCSSAEPIQSSKEFGNQYNWDRESTTPRELKLEEIKRIAKDYQTAAKNALLAGFDMVELHAAHGYLIEQFIADGVNKRTDSYGGSISNRCRILFEIIEALIDVVGPNRLAVRLSPVASNSHNKQVYFGVTHSNPESVYEYIVENLNQYKLAYLLLTEPRVGGLAGYTVNSPKLPALRNAKYREIYKGMMIGAGGFSPNSAREAIDNGCYDLIAFGRWFLSNPDLVGRLKSGADLNVYHRASFYGGDEQGYTDYPDMRALRKLSADRFEQVSQNMIGQNVN